MTDVQPNSKTMKEAGKRQHGILSPDHLFSEDGDCIECGRWRSEVMDAKDEHIAALEASLREALAALHAICYDGDSTRRPEARLKALIAKLSTAPTGHQD